MQLVLLFLLFSLLAPQTQTGEMNEEIFEVIKYFSGEEEGENIKNAARQIQSLLNAAKTLNNRPASPAYATEKESDGAVSQGVEIPLLPIKNIADERIFKALEGALSY